MTIKLRSARPQFLTDTSPTIIHEGALYQTHNAAKPYSLKRDLEGRTRFEWKTGDRWPNDDPLSDRARTEVLQYNKTITYGESWWLRWAFTFEAENGVVDAYQTIVGQIHGDDSLGSKGPFFSLWIEQDTHDLIVRTARDTSTGGWRYDDRYRMPLTLGKEYNFIARIKPGYPATGELDFWVSLDGGLTWNQVISVSGADIGFSGDLAPYFKWGLYIRPDTSLQHTVATYKMQGPTKTSLAPT